MAALSASIIVPTYNRPDNLLQCLRALSRQTMAKQDYEVIVVDDGSPQSLREIVTLFQSELAIKLVRQANAGPASARNLGLEKATGKLVAFTDDDCLPEPEWLEKLVARARKYPGSLIGGTTLNGLPENIFASTSQLIVDLVYEHFNADSQNGYFLASNNMLCDRVQLLGIGGFDTTFQLAGGEDRELCDRWRAAGLRLIWAQEAIIYHHHHQTFLKFIDLHIRYGRGAYRYQLIRKARGSGTMQHDVGFHLSIPRLASGRLGREMGHRQSAKIIFTLLLWELANAIGFVAEAFKFPR